MNATQFRNTLKEGGILNGIWRTTPGSELTEIIAEAGFDFQILDLEHGALDWSEVQTAIRLNRLLGKTGFIRLGDRTPVAAQRALDTGADGIVYPQVETAEEVATLAENLSYAPAGKRGFNPFVAGSAYGGRLTTPNEQPLLMPIVETKSALENLPVICAIPQVDVIYLGAYDLSVQFGTPGDIASSPVISAMKSAIEICKSHGCAVGLMVNSRDQVKEWSALGVQVFLHGVDCGIIRKSFSSILNEN
jgi:2-keto-3-deoxy-L-rhamnonate aldolase RhmA